MPCKALGGYKYSGIGIHWLDLDALEYAQTFVAFDSFSWLKMPGSIDVADISSIACYVIVLTLYR